jgi:hypothetical protein
MYSLRIGIDIFGCVLGYLGIRPLVEFEANLRKLEFLIFRVTEKVSIAYMVENIKEEICVTKEKLKEGITWFQSRVGLVLSWDSMG